MNNEILLSIKNHTDTLIGQTETRPQETVEFKLIKQMHTFSFPPPINLTVEGKRLLAIKSSEAYNSAFKITEENKVFQCLYWALGLPKGATGRPKGAEIMFHRLIELLENNESDLTFELHDKEVMRRRSVVKLR